MVQRFTPVGYSLREAADIAKLDKLDRERPPPSSKPEATKANAADNAYATAERLISKARKEGAARIDFDREETHALNRLPKGISDLPGLQILDLDNTQVADLSPLFGLTRLTTLFLSNTKVSDLGPLSGLTRLTKLGLNETQVSDLTPLSSMAWLTELVLDDTPVSDLGPLSGQSELRRLVLGSTQVSDLSPLSGLVGLTTLTLDHAPVSDLGPLSGLTGLTGLWLGNTLVSDLRPIRGLRQLMASPEFDGLTFQNCSAAKSDARIAEIAEIENNAERARTLFDYLETWVPPGEVAVDTPPPPDALLPVYALDDRLEVAASTPSEAEREERLKQVLHQRLRDKAAALAKAAGNRFARLAARARALEKALEPDLADADLLGLHLAVGDLEALNDLGREDDEGEAFPPEVTVPLADVLRLGPGLTLGHADVDLLEERANRRRTAPPVPEAEQAAQDEMSRRVAADAAAIGDRLRALEQIVANSLTPEAKEAQKAVNRNLLWKIAASCLRFSGQVTVGLGIAVTATQFTPAITNLVSSNWAVLTDAAATYGPQFARWFITSVTQIPEFAGLAANVPPKPKAPTKPDA